MVVEKNKSEKFSVCRTVPNGAERCPSHLSLCPRDVPNCFLLWESRCEKCVKCFEKCFEMNV